MEEKIKYGIIGSGMMGREHIHNISLLDNTEVIALADPSSESLESAKDKVISCFNEEPKLYADYKEMLKKEKLDAVVIAAPNHKHYDILLYIFNHYPHLAILAEKPLATNIDDAKKIYQMAQNHKAPIWVAMEYRYIPVVAQLVSDVHNKSIGNLKMLSIREHRFPFLEKVDDWNRFSENTGGTLVEKCCHFFDLMRLITDDEPVSIYASGGADVNHLDEEYNGRRPDINDNAFVVVNFQSGKRALLDICMFAEGSEHQELISAIGDKEKVEAFIPSVQRFWPGALDNPDAAPKPFYVQSPRQTKQPKKTIIEADPSILNAGDHQGSTYYQHQNFKEAILGKKDVEVTAKDGMLAVLMGLAAEQSIKENRVIFLDEYGV